MTKDEMDAILTETRLSHLCDTGCFLLGFLVAKYGHKAEECQILARALKGAGVASPYIEFVLQGPPNAKEGASNG